MKTLYILPIIAATALFAGCATTYVSNEDLDKVGTEIVWINLETNEEKIYKLGEYEGSISFRDEYLKVKLIVKDTKPPIIEGTKDIKIRLYASPITQAIENIEGMLKMPTGCFEQTSSSLYPLAIPFKFFVINFATAVDKTLASVLG